MPLDLQLKILTVVAELGKGGTARGAAAFACRYKSQGVDSRVCYVHNAGVRRYDLEADGMLVQSLEELGSSISSDAWMPDIIHLHSHGLSNSDVERIKRLCPGAKLVETNIFSIVSEWELMLDASFQLSDWGVRYYMRQSKKRRVMKLRYPILDSEKFKPSSGIEKSVWRKKHNIKESDIVIGRVGQAYSGKWSCHLVAVFEELYLIDSGFRLVVVNPPVDIRKRIGLSKRRSQITVIDEIESNEELAACYSSIDIFLHIAEQGESYGLVLQESILCGTPVVTLETPWADNAQCEHVYIGSCGYSVKTKVDLVKKVLLLSQSEAMRTSMGLTGRESLIREQEQRNELSDLIGNSEEPLYINRCRYKKKRLELRQQIAVMSHNLGLPSMATMACVGFMDPIMFREKLRTLLVLIVQYKGSVN